MDGTKSLQALTKDHYVQLQSRFSWTKIDPVGHNKPVTQLVCNESRAHSSFKSPHSYLDRPPSPSRFAEEEFPRRVEGRNHHQPCIGGNRRVEAPRMRSLEHASSFLFAERHKDMHVSSECQGLNPTVHAPRWRRERGLCCNLFAIGPKEARDYQWRSSGNSKSKRRFANDK